MLRVSPLSGLAGLGLVLLASACANPPAGWPRVGGGLGREPEPVAAGPAPAIAEMVPEPALPPPSFVMPLPDDRFVIDRFRTAAELRDQAFMTPAEYAGRRAANLGALLPLTAGQPPAAGLDRPLPAATTIASRLDALARARASGVLSAAEHAAERAAILEALLPVSPTVRSPLPTVAGGKPGAIQRLGILRDAGLITSAEQRREEKAIAAAVAAAPAPGPGGSSPPARAGAAPPAAAPGRSLAPLPPLRVVPPAPGPGGSSPPPLPPENEPLRLIPAAPASAAAERGSQRLVLGTYPSRAEALRSWTQLHRAHRDVLATLTPTVAELARGPGKSPVFQLVVGPLGNAAGAARVCRTLEARHQACRVVVEEE